MPEGFVLWEIAQELIRGLEKHEGKSEVRSERYIRIWEINPFKRSGKENGYEHKEDKTGKMRQGIEVHQTIPPHASV